MKNYYKIGIVKYTDHASLNRIELGVLENNLPAIRLYEKNGFVKEGIKRNSNYKNGKYISMIMMSLLKEEYLDIERVRSNDD